MEMTDQPAGAAAGGGPDRLRLKVASGNAAGSVIEVEDELVIGRQAAGAGTLGNDIEISRQHARISCGPDGRYAIEDLGSTNGTFVNGRAVEGPMALEAGDRIEIGASALIVQVSAPPPTPRSTPVTTTSAEVEAPEAPEPAPAAEAQPPEEQLGVDVAPAGLPPLSLRLDVDVDAGVVSVSLEGEDADVARFVHEDGRWRLA